MDSRWARVARGCTAASFAVFVAAFSHTIAGGPTPSVFGVGAALVISVALSTLLAGRTQSLLRLTVAVGMSQLLFHRVFSALGAPVAPRHDMTAMATTTAATTAPAHHADGWMWLAHAVAAVITIAALRYAGRAFWGLAGTARLLFARFARLVVPVIVTPGIRSVVATGFLPRDLALLLSPMRHRGPPPGLA